MGRANDPTPGDVSVILPCILTRVQLVPLGELMRRFQHFHQEGVDGRVPNQFEEEQVLQALQTNGAQCWEPKEELREPARSTDDRVRNTTGHPVI